MGTDLLSGHGILSVVEGYLQDLVRVEETHVCVLVGDAGDHVLNAAADAVFTRFLDVISHGKKVGHADVVIEEGRMAVSAADALKGKPEGVAVDIVVIAEGHGGLFGGHLQD